MIRIDLTKDERYLLKQYFKTSPLRLVRLKAQAVLMKSRNLKFDDVSEFLAKDKRTIQRWMKDFSKRRIASIFTGHKNNENACKLTRGQKEEIAEILKKPPSAYGLPKEFWDVPTLKRYVKAEFGTIYESRQSYHFILKFSNLSFKQPDKFNIRRDEQFIGQRMNEIKAEIKDYLKDNSWEVFTADEARIQLEAITKRAWLRKGEKTIVKVRKSNECQNYIGLLNQKNFKCCLYELEWQNQEKIIEVLKKFSKNYPNKKICIIWDNAKFHKGKLIRENLKRGEPLEKLHLINLPPYAPDKNPVEHVWKDAKQRISNIQFEDFNKTKDAFRKSIARRKFNYKM